MNPRNTFTKQTLEVGFSSLIINWIGLEEMLILPRCNVIWFDCIYFSKIHVLNLISNVIVFKIGTLRRVIKS